MMMVSNDTGSSFLPNTLTDGPSPRSSDPSISSSLGSSKKKKKKGLRRSVSFTEDAPVVTEIDSVKSLLAEDGKEGNEAEIISQIWYDKTEVDTFKEDNKMLIYEHDEELSVAGGGDGQEPDKAELERKLGDSLRGLERQTEEGSWAHFQNRAKALGAVLDDAPDDADDLASLATEATQEARSEAHKRALQDEKEAQEYLSDVRESMLKASTISFTEGGVNDDDDASVLTANSGDDDSITSEFTNTNEGEDAGFGFDDDEVIDNNKFANVKIEGGGPLSSSKDNTKKEKSSSPTKKKKVKRTQTAPSKMGLSTMNKPEKNEIPKNKEKELPKADPSKRRGSGSLLTLSSDDDNSEADDDVDFCPVVGNRESQSSLGLMRSLAQKKKKANAVAPLSSKASKSTGTTSAKASSIAAAPPSLEASKSLGGCSSSGHRSMSLLQFNDDKEEDNNISVGHKSTSMLLQMNDDNDEPAKDFDADARDAIKALKKTRKKIRRSKTAPKTLDLMTTSLKKDLGDDDKKARRRVSRSKSASKRIVSRSKSASKRVVSKEAIGLSLEEPKDKGKENDKPEKSKDDDDKKPKKKKITRSKTMPASTTNDDDDESGRDMNDGKRDADGEKPKKRSSSILDRVAKFQSSSNQPDNPPSIKSRASSTGSSKKKERASSVMGGALGMLIADSSTAPDEAPPEEPSKRTSSKKASKSSSDNKDSSDGATKARRHTMQGALGSLMSLADNDDENEEEEEPKQRASTGDVKKKALRRSSSNASSATPTRRTPSRSDSARLPSNTSRVPGNAKRSSLARVPRRKGDAADAPKKAALRRSSSAV